MCMAVYVFVFLILSYTIISTRSWMQTNVKPLRCWKKKTPSVSHDVIWIKYTVDISLNPLWFDSAQTLILGVSDLRIRSFWFWRYTVHVQLFWVINKVLLATKCLCRVPEEVDAGLWWYVLEGVSQVQTAGKCYYRICKHNHHYRQWEHDERCSNFGIIM